MCSSTLTTDQSASLSLKENLLDNTTNVSSCGKAKTVVSKLVKAWRKLNHAECNASFFSSLLSKNISTRDIHSFISKQAGIRKTKKDLDKPLSRKAMRAKLNDACAFANRQKRIVNHLKKELLKAVDMKVYTHRRTIKQIRDKMSLEKKEQMDKDVKKVQRYEAIQSDINTESQKQKLSIPASIQHFASIKAFNPPQETPIHMDPPVVYDRNISLSQDEMNLLSKGPKFAVRQALTSEDFKVELEKMVSKQKFAAPEHLEGTPAVNKCFKGNTSSSVNLSAGCENVLSEQKSLKTPDASKPVFAAVSVPRRSSDGEKSSTNRSGEQFATTNHDQVQQEVSRKNDLHTDFEQKRSQLVYDFTNGVLDTTKLRATDYKFNRTTTLPKAESAEMEARHELRKTEALRVFNTTVNHRPNKSKSKSKSFAENSNLTPSELKGSNPYKNVWQMVPWLSVKQIKVENCTFYQKTNN